MLKAIFNIFISVVQIWFLSCTKSTRDNISDQSSQNNSERKKELNKNIYDLSVKTMEGEDKNLSDYKDKVLMIVNVASNCGYTKQYKGLETVYKNYHDKGFEILGFPCNDFGGQEPGTNDEIKIFCESKYNITFPLFDKVHVLGNDQNPLYRRLIDNSNPPGDIKWNFEKFIINRNGDIVGRFKSKIEPESSEITSLIEKELPQ